MLFSVAVYTFTALFGYALRAAEIARRRNQELLTDLRAAQDKIKEPAVSEEHNRLAREIHDGLGHYLTATTMQIQGAKAVLESTGASVQSPAALGALGKAETLLQEALAGAPRDLNPQVALTLHRVAQEGLTNIHQHAYASLVTLLLGYDRDQVRLTIGDDGKGAGTDAAVGGYGLIGLRERVQLVGGAVNMRSASGQGLQLEIVIPG